MFKTKTVKIDTLGEYLTSVRNQLNFDLKTAAELAQIKPAYLADLERGNYAQLPAEVYIRGFLKSLAQLYRIKEEILVDQYEKERGLEPAAIRLPRRPGWQVGLTPKTLVISISILVALGAVFYVVNQIRSVLAPPFLEVSEPAADTTAEGGNLVVSGQAEVGADVFINNQAVLADSTGQFTENLVLSPGLNVIEIKAENKFGKISTVTRQVNSQITTVEAPTPAPVEVTIQIGPSSAWVDLEADGIVVVHGTMLPGSSKTVTATKDVILTSANAGSTKVIYNGKDLGQLGRDGEVIRNVEFSSQ